MAPAEDPESWDILSRELILLLVLQFVSLKHIQKLSIDMPRCGQSNPWLSGRSTGMLADRSIPDSIASDSQVLTCWHYALFVATLLSYFPPQGSVS